MIRDKELVCERIRQNLCPICGNKPTGPTTLVFDAYFGEIFICSHHMVRGNDKLVEDKDKEVNSETGS